jgi:hypothetical protein
LRSQPIYHEAVRFGEHLSAITLRQPWLLESKRPVVVIGASAVSLITTTLGQRTGRFSATVE